MTRTKYARISPANEMTITNTICAKGFYRFGALTFYPEMNSAYKPLIRSIETITADSFMVRETNGAVYLWTGALSELFQNLKDRIK